jgi:sodium transport system permease protein
MRSVWIVFCKETMDNLRDRRSLALALVYPLIGALLLGMLMSLVGGMFQRQQQPAADGRSMTVTVMGAEHAPDLMANFSKNNVDVVTAPKDPRGAVRSGSIDTVLVIPPGFQDAINAEKKVTVEVLVNATRLSTVITITRVLALVRSYSKTVSDLRLSSKGIDPASVQAVNIVSVNVGRARNLAGFFVNIIPPFLIFTIFVGGVYLAIDTTAGERERGSMEPLLTNPVDRWKIMLGKAMATFLFTTISLSAQLLAFKVMLDYVAAGDFGLAINPSAGAMLLALLVCLPMIAFAVGLQMLVATVSRSIKETQTYLGLLPLIPSLPGMILIFVPLNSESWMMTIPTFGQVLLIGKLMRIEPIVVGDVLIASASTGLVAAVLFLLVARLYNREQLLFSA